MTITMVTDAQGKNLYAVDDDPYMPADSLAGIGSSELDLLPLDSIIVYEGSSTVALEATGTNFQWFADLMSGSRFRRKYLSNQAVGGNTIGDLGGDSSIAVSSAAQIAAVLAFNPAIIFLQVGQNDIAGGYTDASVLLPFYTATLDAYFEHPSVQYVVLATMPPRNQSIDTAWLTAMENCQKRLNSMLIGLRDTYPKLRIVRFDLDNEKGNWDKTASNLTHDSQGVHANWKGAYIEGFAWSEMIKEITENKSITDDFCNADNMVLNPQMYGTAGSKLGGALKFTGEVPDSWFVNNTVENLTGVCSKSTLNGANACKIVMSAAADAIPTLGGKTTSFGQGVSYSGAVGEEYEAAIDILIEGGALNLFRVVLTCDTGSSQPNTSAYDFDFAEDLKGTVRTISTGPLSSPDTTNSLLLSIYLRDVTLETDIKITLSRAYLRKVVY